jgi:hypothetical protein
MWPSDGNFEQFKIPSITSLDVATAATNPLAEINEYIYCNGFERIGHCERPKLTLAAWATQVVFEALGRADLALIILEVVDSVVIDFIHVVVHLSG